jgi:chaperone required for assembly of F1-ATPase
VDDGGRSALLLDGKPVRTPANATFSVTNKPLADAIAEEWRGQGEHIDPQTMPLTKLANTAIDGVAKERAAVIEDILAHARADLLCYRASEPERLVAKQAKHWDPVIAWAQEDLGAPFKLAEGLVHVDQPEESIAKLRVEAEALDDFGLAALHVMAALTGSALLPLAVARKRLTSDNAWAAAHVDEDFQIGQWGEDAEARARREDRKRDYDAAARALGLCKS